MKERRLGRVVVDKRVLVDAVDTGDAANLFAGSIPLDISRDFLAQRVTYILWHRAFDVIQPGQIIPEYVATFDRHSSTPRWERKA